MDAAPAQPRRRSVRWPQLTLILIGVYLLAAYLILPMVGEWKARRHPDLVDGARLTHTGSGIPGDPLNVALIGSREELIRAMGAAGWRPADALAFRSDVRIAFDSVFERPDPDAPVSNLYLYGRREDFAFEKPVGHSPRERHHVRWWKRADPEDGRAMWMGAATFDNRVELSRTTAEITHHVSPDVDADRDLLIGDLAKAGMLRESRWIDGFHKELEGRNGGGDRWHTDGRLLVGVLLTSTEAKP
jgi:hypothetical protein